MPAVLDPLCWTNLTDFKEHLDIDSTDTSKDNFLINVLNAAWKAAVNYIGYDLNVTNYVEYYDGDGSDTILLEQFPVISITSIYDDTARQFGPETLLQTTDYVFYPKTGKVQKLNSGNQYVVIGIPFSPIVFNKGVQNVQVTYQAGYNPIPYDAARAVILLGAWYAQRAGTEGKNAETLGGKTVQYDAYSIPLWTRQLLLPYKKFAV